MNTDPLCLFANVCFLMAYSFVSPSKNVMRGPTAHMNVIGPLVGILASTYRVVLVILESIRPYHISFRSNVDLFYNL